MGLLDAGLDKQIEKIVKSVKLLCPFTIGLLLQEWVDYKDGQM